MDAVQLNNLCSDGVSFCPIVVNEGFVFGLEPDFQSFNLLGIFFGRTGCSAVSVKVSYFIDEL